MLPRTWLSRFVETVRVAEFDGPCQLSRLPDGRVNLVFRVLADATGDLSVTGPRTRAMFKTKTGIARMITIELKPGWSAQLFGVPAHLLTDRIVLLQDIWGRAGTDLCHQLLDARSVPEVIDRISHAIATRTEQIVEPASARLARRAVRLMQTENARIASVAHELGVTPRHLRRAFHESVGISPKDFSRTLRLNRAVRNAKVSADWGRIATDAGYYDQAHLISDFRELVGLTPRAFAKSQILAPAG